MIKNGNAQNIENLQQRRLLIQIFSPQLVDKIGHPEDMIPYLPCLTEEEGNELQACKDTHGDQQTVMKMLFFLVLKGPEMYGQLINALEKTKQPPKLVQDLKDMVGSDSFSDLLSKYIYLKSYTRPFPHNSLMHLDWKANIIVLICAVGN